MAGGKPVGTMFVEIGLDSTKLEKGLKDAHDALVSGTVKVESAYKVLGIKSDAIYEQMKQNASAAVDFIKNKTMSSHEEIVRAQKAAADQIKRLNEEQFGHQKSLMDQSKEGWIALAAGVTAAYVALQKFAVLMGEAAKDKRLVDQLDALTAKYGTTGELLANRMQGAAKGLLSVGAAADLAGKQLLAGMSPTDIEKVVVVSERLSKVWGTDVAGAVELIGRAAMTGRDRALKAQGVIVDFKKAYKDYADSIGVAKDALDGETKQMIGMQEVANKSAEILERLAKYQDSSAAAWGRMTVAVADVRRELGMELIAAFNEIYKMVKEYPVAFGAAAGALAGFALAGTAVAVMTMAELVPAIGSAVAAIKLATTAMMTNPVVLAFAAAIGVAAAAFVYFKGKADEAKKANDEFVASLKAGGQEQANTMVSVLTEDLNRAKVAFDEAAKKSDALARTKFGWNSDLAAAREETGKWANEVKRLEGLLKSAQRASGEMGAEAAERARRQAEAARRAAEERAKADAEKYAKDVITLNQKIVEDTRKTNAEIEGIGQSNYEKAMALIDSQAEAWRKLGASEVAVSKWVAAETLKAQKILGEEIIKAETVIYDAVMALREKMTKDQLAAIVHNAREELRVETEKAKGLEDFNKRYKEALGFRTNAHDRAMETIILNEEEAIAKNYEDWEKGYISLAQLDAANAAERAKTGAATDIQLTKKLETEVQFYATALGMEEKYREKKLALIEKERLANIAAGISSADAAKKAAQEIGALDQALFVAKTSQLNAAAQDMQQAFTDIGSMFSKTSREYGVMQEAAKGMYIAQKMVAVANAVAAIANQGLGDPYTAIPRIAAMVATMASLLSTIGASVTGGGGTAEVRTSRTALGVASTENLSSPKDLMEMLDKTYELQYRELTGINSGISALNENITRFVTGTFKAGGGFPSGGGLNVQSAGYKIGAITAQELLDGILVGMTTYAIASRPIYGEQVNEIMRRTLSDIYIDILDVLKEGAKFFGTDLGEIGKIVFDAATLNLAGMDAEEATAALQDYISDVGGAAAEKLFGEIIGKYQKLGESLLDTLVRLMTEYSVVSDILEKTGQHLHGTTQEALAFVDSLVEIAGGLENLQELAANYNEKFFSEAERLAQTFQDVVSGFGTINDKTGLNLAMPSTREEFRALVESLDLTTESGRQAYIMLLRLADSADELYSAQERLTQQYEDLQDRLLSLQGDDGAILARQRERELAATDTQLHSLLNAIYAQEDYNTAVENATKAQADYDRAVENTAQAMADVESATIALANAQDRAREASERVIDAQQRYDEVVVESAERVADAQERYADVVADGAERIADAHERYADAVKDGQQRIVDANERYEEAVTDGAKRIADAEERLADAISSSAERIADAQERYADTVRQGAEQVANAQQAYADALARITDAEEAYADAQQAYADEVAQQAHDRQVAELEARLKAESDARQAQIKSLQTEKDYWDERQSLMDDELDAQKEYVDRLRSISSSVKNFVAQMNVGSLAPATSRVAYDEEYQRLKALATAPGADESAVSDFLSFAKEYLDFQRAYGGDYLATFDRVMADVTGIGEVADRQLVIAEDQLATAQAAADDAKANAERIALLLEQAQAADEIANEEGQRLLDELNQSVDDAVQRLADLQEQVDAAALGIVEAQQAAMEAQLAIGEAQAEAAENTAEALQAVADAQAEGAEAIADAQEALAEAQAEAAESITDALEAIAEAEADYAERTTEALDAIAEAEADYAERVDDAAQAIVDAQEAGDEAIKNALDAIADAQEAATEAQDAIADALEELDRTEKALLAAQQAEAASLARRDDMARQQLEATIRLESALRAYASTPPPTIPGLPPPGDIPGTGGFYDYDPNRTDYPSGWGVPAGVILPPGYDPTQDPNWDEDTNSGANPMGFWSRSPFYSGSSLFAAGGLATGPSIFGEKGTEWAVPTYEPERSNFLQGAPPSFWENLGLRPSGSGEGGAITITVPVTIDGKVLSEVVAKHIPRSAELATAIRGAAGRGR